MSVTLKPLKHRSRHSNVLTSYFVFSAATILAITGGAKIWTAFSGTTLLAIADPITGFSFRHLMLGAGIIEVLIVGVCLFSKSQILALSFMSWLATSFFVYRIGFLWVGWHKPCGCMGNLTDALHIPPQTADTTIKFILAYLLIGSYGLLLNQWWKSRKLTVARLELGGAKSK